MNTGWDFHNPLKRRENFSPALTSGLWSLGLPKRGLGAGVTPPGTAAAVSQRRAAAGAAGAAVRVPARPRALHGLRVSSGI